MHFSHEEVNYQDKVNEQLEKLSETSIFVIQ